MPQLTGIDFLKQLSNAPSVIFTTAYPDFALDGFELDAIDYLVKPINFQRFLKAANKAEERILNLTPPNHETNEIDSTSSDENPFIYLKAENKMQKLILNEILVIESIGHYVKIRTSSKQYVIHQSITELETRLASLNFIRIHRSFIISLDHIEAYTTNSIDLKSETVPIGRSYKEAVMEVLNNSEKW